MQKDQEYIISSFEKNFVECKGKKIALYGKGPHTKLILDVYGVDYNIVGIMDRDLQSGVVYGKQVLSYQDVLEKQVELIIVISRPSSAKSVFQRIHNFCSIYHILCYGINGENLFMMFRADPEADEAVLYHFEKHFFDCKNKRIVLYGKGPRTKLIVEAFPDYNILGIMDKNETDGNYYGKEILSYEKVIEQKADMIIAVTRPHSTSHVYHRIGEFCSYHHISLFDVEGASLFETQGKLRDTVEPNPYFDVCEDDLRKQIQEHDIISFDVFDTLVMRKTMLPTDVFDIVGDRAKKAGLDIPHFSKLRKKTESEQVQKHANLYDIYDALQELTGISKEQKKQLIQLEISVEKQVLIRREKMVELMQYALEIGKRVCLISDMYLPCHVMEEILTNLNICGYEKLFVSCDYCISKATGIYEVVKKQITGDSYLHIGDNKAADGWCANHHGIDSFLIKKSLDMLDLSSYAKIRGYLNTVNERSIVGLLIARIFNNPFVLHHTEGRPEVSEAEDFAYLFVAPLMTSFIIWLTEEIKKRNYDDILFAARDGYLIQRLYNMFVEQQGFSDMPKGIYFQTSRMVVTNASMQTEDDIRWMFSQPFQCSPKQLLEQRFGMKADEIMPYHEDEFESVLSYALAQSQKIYMKSADAQNRYLTYMEHIGLDKNKKYALFDFVAQGTCQHYLTKIIPYDITGFYFCFYDVADEKKRALKRVAMINDYTHVKDNSYCSYDSESYFFHNYLLLESILTSSAASLIDFDQEGTPVFGEEVRTDVELKFVEDTQKAIEDYLAEYAAELYVANQEINMVVLDKLYSFKDSSHTNEHCKVFDEFYLFEDFRLSRIPLERNKNGNSL